MGWRYQKRVSFPAGASIFRKAASRGPWRSRRLADRIEARLAHDARRAGFRRFVDRAIAVAAWWARWIGRRARHRIDNRPRHRMGHPVVDR